MIEYVMLQMELLYKMYAALGYLFIIAGVLLILFCVIRWTRG